MFNYAKESAETVERVYKIRRLIKLFTYRELGRALKTNPSTAKLKIDGPSPLKRHEVLRLKTLLRRVKREVNEILI